MTNFFNSIAGLAYDWVLAHGVAILVIIVGAYIARRLSKHLIAQLIRRVIKQGSGSRDAEEKRENTLIQVVGGFMAVAIYGVAGMMVLSEAGVEVAPLIAAAGVAGLAFSFGGQYLIRDLIAGVFIIVENQYRTGDVICIGDTCGSVENITLRLTTLRDLDGTVHHVPHGEIARVANMTKGFSRINMDIGVGYGTDIQKVEALINGVGQTLAADTEFGPQIIEPPKFLRVSEFADSAITIKILGETHPGKQWAVAGEFRRRLKKVFDDEGIEIPFPQMVLHQALAPKKPAPKRVAKKAPRKKA